MAFHQLKHQCLFCNTAFIVYTESLGSCDINQTHCPQCGEMGTFLRHDTRLDGDIDDVVPGNSSLSQVGQHVEEQHQDGELYAYVLKEDVRRRIEKKALCDGLKSLLSPDLRVLLDSMELEYGHAPYEDGPTK